MKLIQFIIFTCGALSLTGCTPSDPRSELLKDVDRAWTKFENGEITSGVMRSGDFADYRPIKPNKGSRPISTQDIGSKYHLVGAFGPLYSPFEIEGIVTNPPDKRDESENNKTIWVQISKADKKPYKSAMAQKIYSTKPFAIGTKVKLKVREHGKLIAGDSIDRIISNPTVPQGPAFCHTSLHLERVIVSTAPNKTP